MENQEFEIMYRVEQSHWWFRGKQFLLRQNVTSLDQTGLEKGRVLDIGSGTGITLKVLGGFGDAYGLELSQQAIGFLKKRHLKRIICADVNLNLPLKNDSFKTITCLDVIEHLDNDVGLLKEMLRVCKPGGHILLTVPAFDIFWSPHDVALHHKRRYTRKDLLQSFSGLNCKVIKATYYNIILSIPILAVRKFKSLFLKKGRPQSDFHMDLPNFLNRFLELLFKAEIWCLKFMNFPFGVSILFVLRKSDGNKPGIVKR